ncbi:NUDIX hydrolase [Virgibacillus sp. FSP13]
MKKWFGSAGVCVHEKSQILMVKQGRPKEKRLWSIPSGGKELNETFEVCCIREIREETGYDVSVVRPLFVKECAEFGVEIEIHYFEVKLDGGEAMIQDPDSLIYAIDWKSFDEIDELELSFPEDRKFLLDFLK